MDLHKACEEGSLDDINAIIDTADVHSTDARGRRPLDIVCMRGRKVVAELIKKGNLSPPHWATYCEALEPYQRESHAMVMCLLAAGARENRADYDGCTALMHAVKFADIEVIRSLVLWGAKLNVHSLDGSTPLTSAVNLQRADVVAFFVENGACVNEAGIFGFTPLMVACIGNAPEIGIYLLKHGANADCIDPRGKTALIQAERYSPALHREILRRKNSADVRLVTSKKLCRRAPRDVEKTADVRLVTSKKTEL